MTVFRPLSVPALFVRKPAHWSTLRGRVLLLALALLTVSGPRSGLAQPATPAATQINRATIELEAPLAAQLAYLDTFRTRQWVLPVASKAEFARLIAELPLRPKTRTMLLDPAHWPVVNTSGAAPIVLRPPLELLRTLSPEERRRLYGLIAQWTPNKPERWPLVIRDEATFAQLEAAGVNPALVGRVRELSVPFAGGFAFSDFSVIADEFPERERLLTFLRTASRVSAQMPRINLRTAGTVVHVLDYWTVSRRNTFAQPLLEALLNAETDTGVEVASIMPSATRLLTNELGPEDVTHDFSYASYLMAVSLAEPNAPNLAPGDFFDWFDRHHEPVAPPYRLGDVLTILRDDGGPQGVAFACAYISEEMVFAKDPVGLGLWRFLPLNELLNRNPNFAHAHFQGFRTREFLSMRQSPPPEAVLSDSSQPPTFVSTGTWGTLRATRIRLTPPDPMLDRMHFVDCSRWSFGSLEWSQIDQVLRNAGLPPAIFNALQDPAIRSRSTDTNERSIRVPDDLRFNLPPAARTALYRELARFESNLIQRLPWLLPTSEGMDRAKLNLRLRHAIDQLAFARSDRRYLVDADLLLPFVTDAHELKRLKTLLFSVPSYSLELLRGHQDELAATIAYWSRTSAPNVVERLQAFAGGDALDSLDVLNLLPPLARRVINSFPDNIHSPRAANCFWTALNFDRTLNNNQLLPNATDLFHSAKVAASILDQDYVPVEPPYRLGDVLTVGTRDLNGKVTRLEHAMVYLASDIVLTKNGVGEFTPFSLSLLADVSALYTWAFGETLQGYRLRSP